MLPNTVCRLLKCYHMTSTARLIGLNQRTCVMVEVSNPYNAIICRLMAGHSKWQNIRHVKAAKDKEKSLVIGKYTHLIRNAVRDKGCDPKANTKLAHLIEAARKNNVPVATIENAMKRATSAKLKFGIIEVLGPGGCYIIVDYETDNISDIRHRIKYLCKKYGCSLPAGEGRWRAFYVQKGILKATSCNSGEALDAEKALDVAIEAGAEDVQLKTTEEETFLEFYTEPGDLFDVKKEVEKSYDVQEAYVGFIANVTVELTDSDMDSASSFLAEMGEMSEIIRLYENVQ